MEKASVGLAVIMHYTAADIRRTAFFKLFFDMLGNLAYVFGDPLRLGENEMVYALDDIFPYSVFDNGLGKVGIVYVSSADAGYFAYITLEAKFLYYRFRGNVFYRKIR